MQPVDIMQRPSNETESDYQHGHSRHLAAAAGHGMSKSGFGHLRIIDRGSVMCFCVSLAVYEAEEEQNTNTRRLQQW